MKNSNQNKIPHIFTSWSTLLLLMYSPLAASQQNENPPNCLHLTIKKSHHDCEDYLKTYGQYVAKEMDLCFLYLKKANKNTSQENLESHIQRLVTAFETADDYKKVFGEMAFETYFPRDLIKQSRKKLTTLHRSIVEETEDLNHSITDVKFKILITQLLISLDPWTPNEEAFYKSYATYKKQLYKNVADTKILDNAIKDQAYNIVQEELEKLQKLAQISQVSNQVRELLTKGTQNLFNSIQVHLKKIKTNIITLDCDNIKQEKIKLLAEQLSKINKAKNLFFTSPYPNNNLGNQNQSKKLLSQNQQLFLEKTYTRVKSALKNWRSNFIQSVQKDITRFNFEKVEKQMKNLETIGKILGQEDFMKEIDQSNRTDKDIPLQKGIKVLTDFIGQTLKKEVEHYEKIDLLNLHSPYNPYIHHPPKKIYASMSSLIKDGSKYYDYATVWKEIKKEIHDKFVSVSKKAQDNQTTRKERNHYLELCQSVLQSLPDSVAQAWQGNLNGIKKVIKKNEEKNKKELEKALEDEDPQLQAQTLNRFKQEGFIELEKKMEKNIAQQIEQHLTQLTEALKKDKISEVLSTLEKLYLYKKNLGNKLKKAKSNYDVAHNKVTKYYHTKKEKIIDKLSYHPQNGTKPKEIKELGELLHLVQEFIKYGKDLEKDIKVAILPSNFQEQNTEICDAVLHFMQQCQKASQENIKDLKVEETTYLLDTLYAMDQSPTKKQWKRYKTQYTSQFNKLSSVNYSSIQKKLADEIKACTSYFVEHKASLVNKEKQISKERQKRYYKNLRRKYTFIQAIEKTKHIKNEARAISTARLLQNCAKESFKELQDALNLKKTTTPNYATIHYCYQSLTLLQNCFSTIISPNIPLKEVEKTIGENIQKLQQNALTSTELSEKVDILIHLKEIAIHLLPYQRRANNAIDKILSASKNNITQIGLMLNQHPSKPNTAQAILNQHSIFSGYKNKLFIQKTRSRDINVILQDPDLALGSKVDKDLLKKKYDLFEEKYKELIQTYLKEPIDFTSLTGTIKSTFSNQKKNGPKQWKKNFQQLPDLLAHIFTLWTLEHATYYFDNKDEKEEEKKDYLYQPRPAQVVAILCILNGDNSDGKLINSLARIRTGEGKSLILAVTSIVLALSGYEVSCACYSQYLSKRDYQAFSKLFNHLGVAEYIHYDTFNNLCERMINQRGDIRQTISHLILEKNTNSQNTPTKKIKNREHQILLIDEVDVFFDKNFYGKVYQPVASLRHPTIKALTQFIWANRSTCRQATVIISTPYQNCCKAFPKWKKLIQEVTRDMIADVKSFDSQQYVIKDGKIGYQEQDQIVFNVRYGYKTLFAYYHEYHEGNIDLQILQEKIAIFLKCGIFSYAEIPKKFDRIIGVTGTLDTLTYHQQQIIKKEYKIERKIYMPSLFGSRTFKFNLDKDIYIEKENDFHTAIKREIDTQLIGYNNNKKIRPILIFFDTSKKLDHFYQSDDFLPLKSQAQKMTVDLNSQEKEKMILLATREGQVTLVERIFGRGTDFVSHNEAVKANGGPHVLQTFLAESLSEEVQIKGRTARQGSVGSYSLIIKEKDLEKFNITKEEVAKMLPNTENLYKQVLNKKRNTFFEHHYTEATKYIKEAKDEHKASEKFVKVLYQKQKQTQQEDTIRKYLIENNKGVSIQSITTRTLVLMDATGSMTNLLNAAKNKVKTMFGNIAKILVQYNKAPDCFSMQFAVYRNYNSPIDKILQSSTWESKANSLYQFIDTITTSGGMGNEAIEIGLAHANREDDKAPISQIILIGDAPANTRIEVDQRRAYYNLNNFSLGKTIKNVMPLLNNNNNEKLLKKAVYWEGEANKLKNKGIKIHTCYLNNDAKDNFIAIANCTGGTPQKLDIHSSQGSEKLTQIVSTTILENIGGEKLVKAYYNMFGNKLHV